VHFGTEDLTSQRREVVFVNVEEFVTRKILQDRNKVPALGGPQHKSQVFTDSADLFTDYGNLPDRLMRGTWSKQPKEPAFPQRFSTVAKHRHMQFLQI
jgi:hypothetical protein